MFSWNILSQIIKGVSNKNKSIIQIIYVLFPKFKDLVIQELIINDSQQPFDN